MVPTLAIVFLAGLSVVTLPAFAVVRTRKKTRHKRREADSALSVEAGERLTRIMSDSRRCRV